MLIQYPYFLYIQEPAAEAEQNFEGDFASAPSAWVFHSKCRDVVNGSGKTIALANGDSLIYAGIVYMPVKSEIVPESRSVIVSAELLEDVSILSNKEVLTNLRKTGKIRMSGTVKGFDKSRLNVRLWL